MLVLAFHHKQDLMSADERGCQCLHAATAAERGDPVSDPERTLLDQNLLECRPAVLMQIKYQLSHQKVLTFLFPFSPAPLTAHCVHDTKSFLQKLFDRGQNPELLPVLRKEIRDSKWSQWKVDSSGRAKETRQRL